MESEDSVPNKTSERHLPNSTMNSKFSTLGSIDESLFDGFVVSDRTTSVDYVDMKNLAIALFESKEVAIAIAVKCNLRGMRVKPDDFFEIKGKRYLMSDLLDTIHLQTEYSSEAIKNKTLGKDSSKKLVSLQRISRAFAAETTYLIRKKKVSVAEDAAKDAADCGLPLEYAFLAAPWGMDDATLKKHYVASKKFAEAFSDKIAKAIGNKWFEGKSKRSHPEALEQYAKFRGIEVSDLA